MSCEARSTLSTVLFLMTVPDEIQARLRAEFPNVEIVIPAESTVPDGSNRFAPLAPSDAELARAVAIIGWEIEPEQLARARELRWFHGASAGVEHHDLAALRQMGVTLTNASGNSAPNMAEHALGMMIAIARSFPRLMQSQIAHAWRSFEAHPKVRDLSGETVVIVGTGAIGQQIARRATAFDMRTIGVRRRAHEGEAPGFDETFGVERLHDALALADHVVLALPDTPRTRDLIGAAALAATKPGAVLYNVGRGATVNTAALIAALQSGHLRGAGLDVTEPEPLPADSPLWDMENVMITSHTSGATSRFWERQVAIIAENMRRFQAGEPLKNSVDLVEGY